MVENTFPQQDLGPLCPGNSHINRPLVLGGSRALSSAPGDSHINRSLS